MSVPANTSKTLASPGPADMDALIRAAAEFEPLPPSTTRLVGLIADEDRDLDEVAETIRLDEALTGRLLGAANSSRSGARVEITTVEEALMRLGPGVILSLAIGTTVGKSLRRALPEYGLSEGELWKHSVASALSIERAGRHCKRPMHPEAFATALLHDIGKLVLVRHLSDEARANIRTTLASKVGTLDEAEQAVLGIGHAELGARIAVNWGLPNAIAVGIRYHHTPLAAPDERSRLVCSQVLLADAIATTVDAGCGETQPGCLTSALAGSLGITSDGYENLQVEVGERLEQNLEVYAG